MEPKKSPRANLNNFSSLFLWLGMVFVLFLTWRVIEYKQYEKIEEIKAGWNLKDQDLEETVEVQQEQPKVEQQQQKKAPPEVIEKVEDEEEVEESVLETTETSEEEAVVEEENIETEEEEEDVEVAFDFIEQPPIYPGCEKYAHDKEKLKDCMSKKIQKFINRKFDTSIAEDLGATGVIVIQVQFVVDKDGRVKDIRARSRYKELELEAKRVISQLPRMKPGEQRGRPTKVRYNLPIKFVIR
ncbi:MAG: energy transducer TonB [Chlorobi bacterium]|nr:energy transducer TonB [Chlorobiota bacterium]